jgi:SAM-dependent methyltransferase
MDAPFLRWLRCPFCGGHFSVSNPANGDAGYGILDCYCGHFPLVAGIPVLKKDTTGALDQVVALIQDGRSRDALLTLISPNSPALAPDWMRSLPSAKAFRWLKHLAHERAISGWRQRATNLVADHSNRVAACDLFNFYFEKKKGSYDYFALRPGQPRHLIALSFVSLIRQPQKPILDLACGCGHLTYSLTQRAEGQQVIGIDDSFFGLYVAKHWIAPQAEFVCCAADMSLPFPDGAFSTAFCSDAFHYFDHKLISFRELERLTRDNGVIILVWVHNALWRCPHDGLPLPPEGYEELIGDIPHRLVADSEVLSRYLEKTGPPLAHSAPAERLAREPVLSIVATRNQDIFQDYGSFEDWPHAEGRLKLNPLFVTDGPQQNGHVSLRRKFPSAFYEEEHKQCKTYLPEELTIASTTFNDLASGKRTSEIDKLIEQLLVIGTPERYQ